MMKYNVNVWQADLDQTGSDVPGYSRNWYQVWQAGLVDHCHSRRVAAWIRHGFSKHALVFFWGGCDFPNGNTAAMFKHCLVVSLSSFVI
jgi:hypothetical protein